MKIAHRATAITACFVLMMASFPAKAEKAEDSEDNNKKTLEEKVDALIARVDSIKGRGDDSVEENGGEIEAAILSAAAMDKAAQKICGKIEGGSYLVLNDQAQVDAELAGLFLGHKQVLEKVLDAAAPGGRAGGPGTGDAKALGGIATITLLADLFSAVVSSEDTYSAISGTLDDVEVLSDMLASRCSTDTVFEIRDDVTPGSASFERFLSQLDNASEKYNAIKSIKADKRSQSQKSAMEAYEAFLKALTTPIDGRVPIVALARTDSWFDKVGTRLVLHLSIEKSGGTLLKRKNLWTGLGAPSLGITSGIIVRYRVSDPSNGKRDSGGVVYCTTKQASFRDVHELRSKLAKVAHCEFPGESTAERAAPKVSGEAGKERKRGERQVTRLGYASVF